MHQESLSSSFNTKSLGQVRLTCFLLLHRFMLGNRVKRKLDEAEDGLEEERCPMAVSSVSQASLSLQHQTVLNMSLMKLYGPQTGAGLGLRRRVLINNVVRHIHDDVRQEGGVSTLFLSAAPPPPAESHQQPPPPPSSSFSILSLDPSCLTPASLLEEDLPVFLTLPPSSSPRPPPRDSFSSALEEIEELGPSSSRPPSPAAARVLFDVIMKEEGCPPSPSSPGSFLTDLTLDDVLFTDIDTSMFDLGSCPPPPKMAPVVTAGGLVRSMSGTQSQPFKMDLAELRPGVNV
ncbi:SERTA domain-containing protein 2-like protein [Lates japonicus]|uniref:SERTA domain-containing protein 2-like protein n=1 Tax=Lates japonicus TaxID=270547 RepID=A0AAD3NBS6_LATJO|nr:SERTA domain-containing protein 2-like protein [Lates japonicus]